MVTKLLRYEVQKDKLTQAISVVQEFVSRVHEMEPDTYYAAYQTPNKYEFIHFMSFTDGSAEEHHQNASYTKKFTSTLYPLCVEDPESTLLTEIE